MRDHFFVEAGPLVGERQHRLAPRRQERDRETGIGETGLCIDRILEEIVEHLAKACRLALDENRLFGQVQRHVRAQIVV